MMRALSLLALVGCSASADPQLSAAQGVAGVPIDTSPPEILVDPTLRGAWLPAGPAAITGVVTDTQSAISEVSVDGAPAEVGAGGVFTIERVFEPGVHTMTVVAEDGSGNRARSTLTVFAGQTEPYRRFFSEAALLRTGEAVSDAAADAIAAHIDGAFGLKVGELFSPHEGCVILDGVVEDIVLGEPQVRITPDAAAETLTADIGYDFVSLDVAGTADVCGVSQEFSAYISAALPSLRVTLVPDLRRGLVVEIDDIVMSTQHVEVDALELLGPLRDAGYDFDSIGIEDALGRAMEEVLGDRAEAAVLLGDLIDGVLPVVRLGEVRHAEGGIVPRELTVTGSGLEIAYDGHFAPIGGPPEGATEQRWLRLAGEVPEPSGADSSLSLSIDTINHALHTAWLAGAFEQEFSDDAGSPSEIIRTQPLLPPLVQHDRAGLKVIFGELLVTVIVPGELGSQSSAQRVVAELELSAGLRRGAMSFASDPIDGSAISPPIQETIRALVWEMLDETLPAPIRMGPLSGGGAMDPDDPVIDSTTEGWVRTDLSVSP